MTPEQSMHAACARLDRLARAQQLDQVTDREWCQAVLRDALSMRTHEAQRGARMLTRLVVRVRKAMLTGGAR